MEGHQSDDPSIYDPTPEDIIRCYHGDLNQDPP